MTSGHTFFRGDTADVLLNSGYTFLRLADTVLNGCINSLKGIHLGDLTAPEFCLIKWMTALFVVLAAYLVMQCLLKTLMIFITGVLFTGKGIAASAVIVTTIFLACMVSLRLKELQREEL